jgi:hypothetical protein
MSSVGRPPLPSPGTRITHDEHRPRTDPPSQEAPLRRSAELDELDLLLVTALQSTPRADWQRLGQLLGTSASTAARRWARLTQAGLAWQSCHPLHLPRISVLRPSSRSTPPPASCTRSPRS